MRELARSNRLADLRDYSTLLILTAMSVQPVGQYVIPRIGWGSRLRAIREDVAHMDQREFAESIGMNKGTYGGHEKRIEVPRGARLVANSIELRWRVPASWVLTGETPATGNGDGGLQVAGAGFEPATSGSQAQIITLPDRSHIRRAA